MMAKLININSLIVSVIDEKFSGIVNITTTGDLVVIESGKQKLQLEAAEAELNFEGNNIKLSSGNYRAEFEVGVIKKFEKLTAKPKAKAKEATSTAAPRSGSGCAVDPRFKRF